MSKTLIYGGIGGGAAVAIAIVVLFVVHANTPQYGLSVNPSTEMVMGTGSVIRLYVINTGSSPLTNIKADYGTSSDSLPILNPGDKVMLSPPASAKMVTVTNDQGVTVTKDLVNMG
ncbi:MAG: hypothetical protein KGH89_04275 [Thaumarchaeota archaeon]|nr:hypothetical protein [Nitrososphaerota archaeon]MDE1866288.1 hypothetical protein [Nitrososphaerota archaeon]